MNDGWRYRVGAVLGAATIAVLAVLVANRPPVQAAFRALPVVGHLPFDSAVGAEFAIEAATAAVAFVVALAPLYRPRPRRILDIAELAVRRVALACIALAAVGYFDYSYRLPRATLLVVGALTLVAVPVWFVAIRRPPRAENGRTLVVGDDPDTMGDVLAAVEGRLVGYVSPPSAQPAGGRSTPARPARADGGHTDRLDALPCLGGISRLESVLVEHDVDTVVLAFAAPDRAEFFGTLGACHEYGVTAKVHREHADSVLTTGFGSEELVDVDLEPWDPLDRVVKRVFDVVFAGVGLLVSAPLAVGIAIAIKLDDGGSVLYEQERTAAFGDTFSVYKFRTMREGAEADTAVISAEDEGRSDPRVTRIGGVLRSTHLDEIPQLASILAGRMSVVGPRPERPELDTDMQRDVGEWRSRWFVKPGLTGLAQINDITGHSPEEKLRYDVEYIRRQSVWFDSKIVVRQLWNVLYDVKSTLEER
ncbi:sugar transferase [Natronomonas marina]|uniref:sugar transferase n=1 Tax=Natronomonas marina TaxID=2961939 RepID=UPI0020C9FF4F|nr:sugar transferase [Natronomonas marina]